MKKLIFCALALGVLVGGGCNKDEMSGSARLGDSSWNVTSAAAFRYVGPEIPGETNYELYLMMNGSSFETDYGTALILDLYFPGIVNDLQPGTYGVGADEDDCTAVFFSYTETDEFAYEITGSVTISRDGDNYSFSCSGTTDDGQEFTCSYTGPVQFIEDE